MSAEPFDLLVLIPAGLFFLYVLIAAAWRWLREPVPPTSNVIGFPAKWHPSMSDALDGPSTRGER